MIGFKWAIKILISAAAGIVLSVVGNVMDGWRGVAVILLGIIGVIGALAMYNSNFK